jgi:hypothetical protein
MAETRIAYDFRSLSRFVDTLDKQARGKLVEDTLEAMRERLAEADREVQVNLGGAVLKRRTGKLARSIDWRASKSGTAVKGAIGVLKEGPASKYAGIHLTGGTITAKNAKFLAIPLAAAKTSAGVSRYPSPLRQSLPAAFPSGVFVHHGVIFGKLGKTASGRDKKRGGSNLVPLFILKHSVYLPKRNWWGNSLDHLYAGLGTDIVGLLQNLMHES